MGLSNSPFKMLWSRGLGAVFNPRNRLVDAFSKAGIEVLGCRPTLLAVRALPLLVRRTFEVVQRDKLLKKRAEFFSYACDLLDAQHRRFQRPVRATLLNDSFSVWYLMRLAADTHPIFSRIAHISLVEPAFASSPHLTPAWRFLHGLGPRQLMAQSRGLIPHFNEVLKRNSISVFMAVPMSDRIVSAQAACDAFERIETSAEKRIEHFPDCDHGLLGQTTPRNPQVKLLSQIIAWAKKTE